MIYFVYVQLEILNTGALEYINRECYANAMFCYVKMFCKSDSIGLIIHSMKNCKCVCAYMCVVVSVCVYEWCERDRERWGRGRKSKSKRDRDSENEWKQKRNNFFSDEEMKNYKCGEMLFIDQCTHEKNGLKLYYAKL